MTEARQTSEYNAALFERLRGFSPRFFDIRTKMGIGENVGFGSTPKAHGVYSAGKLLVLTRYQNALVYPVEDFLETEYFYLKDKHIIISPQENNTLYFLSMYQRKGYYEKKRPETKFLTASDDVYEGIAAHELAHILHDLEKRVPSHIQKVLGQLDQDVTALIQQGKWEELRREYDLNGGEGRIDVIAALFGYKDQVLAKLYYMIECLRTYRELNEANHAEVLPSEAIHICQARINEVLRYCR